MPAVNGTPEVIKEGELQEEEWSGVAEQVVGQEGSSQSRGKKSLVSCGLSARQGVDLLEEGRGRERRRGGGGEGERREEEGKVGQKRRGVEGLERPCRASRRISTSSG